MTKNTTTILLILLMNSSFCQSYKVPLEKINTFLKTFDNGYYGYLEIKDGYLYDRFPSGKYSKSEIKYLGKAYVADPNKKVSVNCMDEKDCVFSTYTDSYHSSIGFSQTTDFNTSELIKLLDNLITAYKGNYTVDREIDYAAEKRKLESLKSTVDITSSNSAAKNNSTGNYQHALQKLNDYLKTFDNGYYGYLEVKDGYVYDRFKAGKYNKFKMEEMEGAVIQEQYKRVIFKCKGDNKCISTDWIENGKEEYTQFTTGAAFNYKELAGLLNDFRDAYLGNNQTAANNSTVSNNKSREQQVKERQQKSISKNNEDEDWDALESAAVTLKKSVKEANDKTETSGNKTYAVPLQKLNEYLKTFNTETYDRVEVKDKKVIFYFKVYSVVYNSSVSISDLIQNTTVLNAKAIGEFGTNEIKIFCKNDKKCFYSTYSNGNVDHFRFFSYSVKDLTKMEQLLNEFIKSL